MAAAQQNAFIDIMDDEGSFRAILGQQQPGVNGFGLSARGVTVFTADYNTARDLMDSDEKQIRQVIKNINSTYRDHSTANRRCYINATETKRILAFYHWTTFAVKEGGATYDTNTVTEFNREWVSTIMEAYTMEKPEVTSQSTALSVPVDKYNGRNWFDVKGQITQLMSTRIGHAGIPLAYILRDSRQEWEDTEDIESLQDRRIATKKLEGPTYDLDNKELFRILANVLNGTTLEDDVNKFKVKKNGKGAWDAITAIVQGASYTNELKRQGDKLIKELFYDPTKNFDFERYYQIHARSHEIFTAASAPVPEWKKINDFMAGIRCTKLQDDYRNIKDDPRYQNFTSFYNKMHENYRTLIDQKIIKPVSIYKRKISSLEHDDNRSGRGRGRGRGGRGRGRGGRYGGHDYNHGRGRGGRGGRGYGRGRGRGGRGRGQPVDLTSVDLSCLPGNVNLTNLTFTDEQWYGFDRNQRDAINALRAYRNQERHVNSFERNRSYMSRHGDDGSTLASGGMHPPMRNIYDMNMAPPLPPRPDTNEAPQQPPSEDNNDTNRGGRSTQSSNAGAAFGRRSRN